MKWFVILNDNDRADTDINKNLGDYIQIINSLEEIK